MLTVGSLFSGIGGLDLGLERAGMTVKWQSEIDPYASRVLAKHWPGVPNHGDIKQIKWADVEPVDVICGGYPCQPFSTAGKRLGTADPRHLWPFVADAISALRPRYAIMENVRGHLSLGGTTVIGDLAQIGYDAEWCIVPASGVGAPHRRDRVIIVAYPTVIAVQHRGHKHSTSATGSGQTVQKSIDRSGSDVAYASGRDGGNTQPHGLCPPSRETTKPRKQTRVSRPFNRWWETEPGVGRVADGVPYRVDRLRALGNAVVPQVAEYIGRLVMEYDQRP